MERNFQRSGTKQANYYDPNTNIAIPIFSIHGNHDDPTVESGLSSLNILSSAGLINYFGRTGSEMPIMVHPILMTKGRANLALYGISHIHDNRFARLLIEKSIKIGYPENTEQFFKLFVLHQNRADRGLKNYVPQENLNDSFDLVIWGHEHDCRITPEPISNKNYFISQPGSSVATSLCEGEAIDKHIGIVYINEHCEFKMEPIKLKTVRPFIFRTIQMNDYIEDENVFNKYDEKQKNVSIYRCDYSSFKYIEFIFRKVYGLSQL